MSEQRTKGYQADMERLERENEHLQTLRTSKLNDLEQEVERLTRERDEWKEIADRATVATSAWIGEYERLRRYIQDNERLFAWQALKQENDQLRAALERIAIGDSTDYPWAKNTAREALKGP
jgi:hypothetical protein